MAKISPHPHPLPSGERVKFGYWHFGHYLIIGAWNLVIAASTMQLMPQIFSILIRWLTSMGKHPWLGTFPIDPSDNDAR